MAFIDSYGLSESSSSSFGYGGFLIDGNGISESQSDAKAHGVSFVFAYGLAECQSDVKAKLSKLVEVVSIVTITERKVRLTFDRPMLKDSKLLDENNYTIQPSTSYGVDIHIFSVEAPSDAQPTYVDIIISEMTEAALYEGFVQVVGGPTDPEGTPIDPISDFDFFYGEGLAPVISSVASVGLNRVDVVFNENMEDNSAIRNKNNYSFDNGLLIINILDVVGDTVKLVTSDQLEGVLYTLTITNP